MKFYKYKLAECDVEDVTNLKRYRGKRRFWIERLKSKILPEIYDMMYDEAIFWTINEARILASNRDTKSGAHNPFLSRALRRGYVATQLMAIRRLVDDSNDSHSLLKLVKDTKKYNSLFTREVCVCFDGLPYDYAEIQQNWMKDMLASDDKGGWMTAEGPDDWGTSARLHGYFDSLIDSNFDGRARTQFIPKRVFRELENKLSKCSKVVTVATQKLAHIGKDAQPGEAKQSWPTFNEIRDAQRHICRVAYEISAHIFQDSSFMPIPTPQFNYLEFLDQPVAERCDFEALGGYWDNFNKEIESWVGIGRP